ncbi:MAG TPA: hypothetical protein VG389_12970 [Myxococcota bacterium]|jgi:hypothetical protein|nr:hypothetical protein [Myxococcota bacterium]
MRTANVAAVAFTLGATALAAGCHLGIPIKSYEPPRMMIPTSKSTLLSAVTRLVLEQKWDIVSADEGRGVVVALTPEEHGEGVVTRERWTFVVADGEVTVAMRLEMKDGAEWEVHEVVCAAYEYLRERNQLTSVWTRALPGEEAPPLPDPRLAALRPRHTTSIAAAVAAAMPPAASASAPE